MGNNVTTYRKAMAEAKSLPSLPEALEALKIEREARQAAEQALVLIGEKAVVDWDDPTVGQVDAVVKDREKYKDWLCSIFDGIKRRDDDIARLKAWVNDLQAGKTVNCVYCGHQYGPEKDTPVAMADVLKAHIVTCPQHPLNAARKALSSLVETKRLKEASGKTPEYEAARKAAWDEAARVLAELGPKEPKEINWNGGHARARAVQKPLEDELQRRFGPGKVTP